MKQTKAKSNNTLAWETIYSEKYLSGGTFLPAWGVHSSGKDLTSSLLKISDKNILEIACGTGESLPYILKSNPKEYIGIDISYHALKQAKKKNKIKNVSFIQSDISKQLPFASNSFNEIFSVYGIGWSQDIQGTLSEIYRVLSPGGHFTFSWDHYLARVIDEENGKIILQNSYNKEIPTIRYNWNQTGYNIQTFQAKPSTWFQMLKNTGFDVTAFYEVASNLQEKEHIFSQTYNKNRLEKVPATIIFQVKKPL